MTESTQQFDRNTLASQMVELGGVVVPDETSGVEELPLLSDPVWNILTRILSCMCAALEHTVAGPVCTCNILTGDVAWDRCCDDCGGQAWVREVTRFPSSQLPIQDLTPVRCGTLMAVQVEMGVIRCYPTMQDGVDNPQLPAPADLAAAALIAGSDATALEQAAICCLDDEVANKTFGILNWIMQVGAPQGPQGGCAGRILNLVLQYEVCCQLEVADAE